MKKMEIYTSVFGDSFWNKCFQKEWYNDKIANILGLSLRWTEPNVLVQICLVILIILPLIFMIRTDENYIKISRLYNVSRLSILTLFHRFLYIYLIFVPLSYVIGQPPPCATSDKNIPLNFQRLYSFPSPKIGSLCFTIFYVGSLFSISYKKSFIFVFLFTIIFSIHFILLGRLSVAQTVFSIALSYILQFYSQRVPFFVMHIENMILTVLIFLIMFGLGPQFLPGHTKSPNLDFTGRMISGIALLIIDWVMIGRYNYTRRGYAKIGKPKDIQIEAGEGQYFAVLSSEEELHFLKNLKNDVIDSFVASVLFLIGVGIRHYLTGIIKPSAIGLL